MVNDIASVAPARVLDVTAADGAGDSSRNRLVLGLLLISAFVVILNETIMGVALPTLIVELQISAATAQWLTTGFLLTTAIVIPTTGFLLQRFSTRAMFLSAMSLFTAGTLVAAVAPGFGTLLTGRIVQALGTAIMMPLLMTTAMNLIPASKRGRTMGNISIVISVAPAIGPTVAGLILSALDWRFLFLIVLPIALAALLLGAVRMPNVTVPRRTPLDGLSVVLSAFAFGGLLYGLSAIGESASGDTSALVPSLALLIGAGALIVFIIRQAGLARRSQALLDLRTFTRPTFALSLAVLAIGMLVLFGSLIILPIYLQNVLALSTLSTGLLLLPGGVVMGLLSPVVGRLYDRIGPTPLVIIGSSVVSAALWMMAVLLTADTAVWVVPVIHVVLSTGLAFTFTPLFSAALGSLPPELYSHASATLSTVQQLAGGAGTAIFITVLTVASVSQSAGGSALDAVATGTHTVFLVAAIASLLMVVASLFVRRPSTADEVPVATMHEGGAPRDDHGPMRHLLHSGSLQPSTTQRSSR